MKKIIFFLAFAGNFLLAQGEYNSLQNTKLLIAGIDRPYTEPLFSPDGQRIAVTSVRYQGIWVADADGRNLRQISDEPASGFGFSWSPDAISLVSRVAKYEKLKRLNAIKMFNTKTGAMQLLSDFRKDLGLPQWVGNENEVAFLKDDQLDISQKTSASVFSKKYISHQKDEIVLHNAGLAETAKFSPIPGARYIDVSPSPDGSKIAFQQVGGNLYILTVNNGRLTDMGRGHRPRWSPDSRYITFMVTTDDGHNFTASDLYISSADGTRAFKLTDTQDILEMNPSWSPDGSRIVYDESGDIFIISNVNELLQ